MNSMLTRSMSGQRGFTLAEVLVAVFVILVGLVAIATGFQYATSGVATGRGETMATFLAQQRIEQLKTVAMTNYDPPYPGVSLAAGTTTEYCQTSNIGVTSANCQSTAISGTTSYTRVTTITDNPGGTGCTGAAPLLCKRIRVSVTYRPVTSAGDVSQARTVDLYAVVAPRS
jgi:prepilin-type N-terminal cleavage/methylation domain-containing protein